MNTRVLCACLLLAGCGIQDLKSDLDEVVEDYGYLKGSVAGGAPGADVLVALFRQDANGETMSNTRTVAPGEPFYMLVPNGSYTLLAFSDTNGDFAYQAGEPAARIAAPGINWFRDMEGAVRVDYDALAVQAVELSADTQLEQDLDLSLSASRADSKAAQNFLRLVTWDDPAFSAENMELGMWQPGAFEAQVGFGLYVLDTFDPARPSIVLVHGINDTPRIFMSMVDAIPDDYQVLLFHYASSFPLEYTSYALNEYLDELLRRHAPPRVDVMAHSMGGLVSKGMIYQADDDLRSEMHTFISLASPYGGHNAAAAGLKWSPVIAPVWWAMAPGSSYLTTIDTLDLTAGPEHHLVYTFSHETGGERAEDDGVVTVESQLADSAQRNAGAIYGVADNHVGVMHNACVAALVNRILSGADPANAGPDCHFE